MTTWRIRNGLRPGYFWSAKRFGFVSLTSGEYSTYARKGMALRVARSLCALYEVGIEQDIHTATAKDNIRDYDGPH